MLNIGLVYQLLNLPIQNSSIQCSLLKADKTDLKLSSQIKNEWSSVTFWYPIKIKLSYFISWNSYSFYLVEFLFRIGFKKLRDNKTKDTFNKIIFISNYGFQRIKIQYCLKVFRYLNWIYLSIIFEANTWHKEILSLACLFAHLHLYPRL